jgi:hypothetical protein
MEWVDPLARLVHIACGSLALLAGPVAMLTGQTRRRSGRTTTGGTPMHAAYDAPIVTTHRQSPGTRGHPSMRGTGAGR